MSLRLVAVLCLAAVLLIASGCAVMIGCYHFCHPKAPLCKCTNCHCTDCRTCPFCRNGLPCLECRYGLKAPHKPCCCDVANPDGCSQEEVQNADVEQVPADPTELVLELGKEYDIERLPIRPSPDGRGLGKLTIVLKIPELEKVAETFQGTALELAYMQGGKDIGTIVGGVVIILFLCVGVVGKGLALLAGAILRTKM